MECTADLDGVVDIGAGQSVPARHSFPTDIVPFVDVVCDADGNVDSAFLDGLGAGPEDDRVVERITLPSAC